MYDGMDALEMLRHVVHSYVINRNSLEFISIRRKDLPDKSDFRATCCPEGKLSVSTKYIAREQVSIHTLALGSLFLKAGE
jgi:hypothetical protein